MHMSATHVDRARGKQAARARRWLVQAALAIVPLLPQGNTMPRPPRSTGGRTPGNGPSGRRPPSDRPSSDRQTFDHPTFDRPTSDRSTSDRPARPPRKREAPGGGALATSPRELQRTNRSGTQRPAPGTESNPFGGRPVKLPRGAGPAPTRANTSGAPRRERGAARATAAAAAPGRHEPQRIAKLLARAGVGSRRDIERMIEEGRVAVNGTVLATPAHIVESLDGILVDGRQVASIGATQLYRFHKPAGFLTTARDPGGRPTIFDVLPPGLPRLLPVGRLDMNTEGLLLLTTDGALKRALELPTNAVARRYRVRAYGEVTQTILESLVEGITIDGMRYGSINADIERRTGANLWLSMTLTEGKNREIRRVLEFLGLQVSRLIRVGYGPFELGDLAVRAVDEVNQQQVEQLVKSVKPRA